MKIVLDTNVLYSAFIQASPRMQRLIDWTISNHDVYVTPTIIVEILEKAAERAPDTLPSIVALLASDSVGLLDEHLPLAPKRVIIRDKNDQAIIDAAISNDIDVIITGDKDYHALELEHPITMYPGDFAAAFLTSES